MVDGPSVEVDSNQDIESTSRTEWSWIVVLRLIVTALFILEIANSWNGKYSFRDNLSNAFFGALFLLLPNIVLAIGYLYRQSWSYVLAVVTDCTFAAFMLGSGLGLYPVEHFSVRYAAVLIVFSALLAEGDSLVAKWDRKLGYRISYWIIAVLFCLGGVVLRSMFGDLD